MSENRTKLARISLGIVLAVAARGVLNPNHDAQQFTLRPDFVEHALYAYVITLLAILALPRVSPWAIVGALVGVGLFAEVTQLLQILPGSGQWHDIASNLTGAAAAAVPFVLGCRLLFAPLSRPGEDSHRGT